MLLDRQGREDLSSGVEPPELGLFFNELMHIYGPIQTEFPNWSLGMQGSRHGSGDAVFCHAILSCEHPKVPHVDTERSASKRWLELAVSLGGVGSDSQFFDRVDVNWRRPWDVPEQLQGKADLLNGEKPIVTPENVERFLNDLPILFSDLRRVMALLP